MQIPVCFIDQRDIILYSGTYRILSLLENIAKQRGVVGTGVGVSRDSVGRQRSYARPLLYLDGSARAQMHTHTHTYTHTQTYRR